MSPSRINWLLLRTKNLRSVSGYITLQLLFLLFVNMANISFIRPSLSYSSFTFTFWQIPLRTAASKIALAPSTVIVLNDRSTSVMLWLIIKPSASKVAPDKENPHPLRCSTLRLLLASVAAIAEIPSSPTSELWFMWRICSVWFSWRDALKSTAPVEMKHQQRTPLIMWLKPLTRNVSPLISLSYKRKHEPIKQQWNAPFFFVFFNHKFWQTSFRNFIPKSLAWKTAITVKMVLSFRNHTMETYKSSFSGQHATECLYTTLIEQHIFYD